MRIKSTLSFLRRFFTRRKIIILVIILVLVGGFFAYKQKTSQKPIEYATVQRQDLKQIVSASGTLSGENVANLKFLSGGKLAYVNVKVGDEASKGALIAGLDTQQLAINLREAKNTLADKQATLEKTIDDIHLFQYGNGGSSNVGTANETEAQKATRTSAEQAVNNAQESLISAQRAYQDNTITSPLDGIVTSQDPITGQAVGPTDIIAQVVDFSQIVFRADVDESDISKVSPGQKAEITINAYGDKVFTGDVSEVIPETKTASNGGTVVTVKITLGDKNIKPIAGLNGEVNIIVNEDQKVLTIPQDALTNDSTVVLKTNNGYSVKKVTISLANDTDIEVKDGLNEGDQVVLNPNDFLKSHPNVK